MVNNFTQRTITGIVFVIIMAGAVVLHPYAFGALFLVVTVLAMLEFYRLVRTDGTKPDPVTGLAGGIVLYILVFFRSIGLLRDEWLFIPLLLLPLVMITELFSGSPRPFTNIAFTLLGILYIALPLSLLNCFFTPWEIPHKPDFAFLLGYFVLLWLNDTGAYLMGKATGKHLLFQRISPKKTWEGIAGGFIAGLLAAWGLSRFFTQLALVHWLIMALLIIVFSTFGDLVESMLKRSVQVKDSGNLLPGHGGVLDRFDGVLLSAPVVYIYLYMVLN